MLKLAEKQMGIYTFSEQRLHPVSHNFKVGFLLNSSADAVCVEHSKRSDM